MEENSAESYYNKFLNLIRLGRIDEAKIFAHRAVELDSTFYRIMLLAGAQNCLTDEKYDEAIIFLDLLIELGFNTHDMWRNKGKAHAMKKDFEQALKCYEMATKINPHDYEVLVERALVLEALGRNEVAIASLEKAAIIDVRNTRALLILGNIHLKMGKFEEGITYYDGVLEMDRDNIEAQKRKSLALFSLHKYTESLQCLDQSLPLNPIDLEFWSYRGVILDALEKYDEAIRCYDRCIEINPSSVKSIYSKGYDYYRLGKNEKALEIYDEALRINPSESGGWYNKGVVFASMSKIEGALECFTKSVELDSANYEAWFNKGIALTDLGKYNEALSAFDNALKLVPSYADAWYHKGRVLKKISEGKSRWSFRRTSLGNADECFKKAKELGFK